MGGAACVAKKKMCNPPAIATFSIPEIIMSDIASGLLDREVLENAGLESYLYRCAAIDEEAQAKYNEANDWFYKNIYRVEEKKELLPKPSGWGKY
jgi:aminoglycoside/choline kinase family phosphotransferase